VKTKYGKLRLLLIPLWHCLRYFSPSVCVQERWTSCIQL